MDKSLSEQEIDRLFMEGDRNLHRGDFEKAIDIFDKLLKILKPNHNLYFNTQRNLIKAYQQNEEITKAIALCQLLIDSNNSVTSIWANKFMSQLDPQFIPKINQEIEYPENKKKLYNPPITKTKPKTLSQFKNYCQNNLLDKLKELERKRIQTLTSIIIAAIASLIITWIIYQMIIDYLGVNNSIIFYVACLSVPASAWIIFCQGCIKIYSLGFKRDIIEKIINFIDDNDNLKYANSLLLEDKRQTIIAFTRSQIFRDELQEPDKLEQEDCVYGTIGKTDIFFAEITVENIKGGSLNEFELTEYRRKSVFFQGLFFEAKFPKNFSSRTFILPHTFKNKLGTFNNWRGENVDLEDPEFKNLFQVYGDNQIESRYILSTSLMSRLVNFRKKAKRKVYLSFIDGFVYIAIPYNYNLFEPKLLKSMTSFTPLKEYFQDLQLLIGIVDELNINRSIWGTNS